MDTCEDGISAVVPGARQVKEDPKSKERSAEQIAIDALTVERAKVQKRLDKIKADLDASPWIDVMNVRQAVASLDLKTAAGRKELERLAEEGSKHLTALRRIQRMDIVKQTDKQFDLEMEIQSIDRMLVNHQLKLARRFSI